MLVLERGYYPSFDIWLSKRLYIVIAILTMNITLKWNFVYDLHIIIYGDYLVHQTDILYCVVNREQQ